MPRFPFKRSVAQDLRDLWAIDRIDRQSRNLGLSSISPGDGSLDLIDGGTTVARYGDGPNGEFGILVPDGAGGWRTVQQDAQTRADAAEQAAKSYAESSVSGLQSEVTTARGGFSTLGGRLDSHAQRLGATEGVANGVQSEVATARGGFGSLNGRLDDHATRVGGAESDIDTLQTDVGRMQAHLSNLSTWLSDVWDMLQSHESRLNALDGGSSPNPGPPPSTMI